MVSPIEQPDKDSSDVSFDTLDTASLVSVESSPSSSSSCHRVSQWPSKFFIPSFSFDVEIRLRKGNEQYEKEQTTLNVPRDMKMEILDKLVELMYSFKAYPTDKEFESVARELVSKHPCLSEPGPDKGWQAWKMSLKHKMGNYRQKLCSAGCFEVTVNQKKKKGVKKPKHAEINFLPDHPPGINEEVLECERRAMVDELKKKNFNMNLLNEKMDITFSMRRQEIVQQQPLVSLVKEKWPGLFLQHQVYGEFKRITGIDLYKTFQFALETYANGLIRMFRTKGGDEIGTLLERLDQQVTKSKELDTQGVKIMMIEMVRDEEDSGTLDSMAVVIEDTVVVEGLPDYPTAFCVLFGLIYALNMEYPKEWKYTFETIQKVFLNLGEQCSARTLSLKNKLLQVLKL
ncbi:sterile alpha motif domain-containing protein 3-like [Erpetoichthys calabaricus]|uniref:sterile alpha motif domain-containing protein 3-like n=1 Tax=Erpetoichthys calabaricus TaxID=27687 RepID=UPI002233FC2D|nr:sterile alpha motif domain-containing protein 3-like [Erpetoichthys calabaricus]